MTKEKNENAALVTDESSEDKEKTSIQVTKPGEQINPLGDELNIMVSLPETLEIKMVNASTLEEYETWFFISSVLSSFMCGFWVAYAQNTVKDINNILFWNSVAFTVIFIISVITAFSKRRKLNEKAKSVKLKASKVIEK